MEQELVLETWLRRKLDYRHHYRLRDSVTVEYEFKRRIGHPSSYAYVAFQCQPAESLVFESTAAWPQEISSEWVARFESAVCEALVDGLVCSSMMPFLGCSLNLFEIKHHEVSSSPAAFYQATKGAVVELTKDTFRRWQIWPMNHLGDIGDSALNPPAA